MTLQQHLQSGRLYLDGGMGTLLQAAGLAAGELPEDWNLTHADTVTAAHRAYFDAGCHVVCTNTFGANRLKFSAERLRAVVFAAVQNARAAQEASRGGQDKFVALDIGPLGRLLAPYGDLPFEQAVDLFAETLRLGAAAGVDLVLIETMGDSYETKAAVLAAKENCDLPVFASNAYGADGKLMTGASPAAMAVLLEGLGVDALGANCSLGPAQLLPVAAELLAHTDLPVLIKPNAGLPRVEGGRTLYSLTPQDFAAQMQPVAAAGVGILGGCCGTTPGFLRALIESTKDTPVPVRAPLTKSYVCSYTHCVALGDAPVLIGERVNPTGKKRLQQALREHDLDYLLREGLAQQEQGADILDVNVGLPGLPEAALLCETVEELQAVCDLPLQLDTADPVAMERALRACNGKPMLNSTSGKQESMRAVFPLAKKYGGVVVALTLDEDGIPETAAGRVRIAKKILDTAAEYGIRRRDIVFDPLCLAVSAMPGAAAVTLEALHTIRHTLGQNTVLGVSNVSFGLPQRPALNAAFLLLALENGLSAAIANPLSADMQRAWHSYRLLHGQDEQCAGYLRFAAAHPAEGAGGTATSGAPTGSSCTAGAKAVNGQNANTSAGAQNANPPAGADASSSCAGGQNTDNAATPAPAAPAATPDGDSLQQAIRSGRRRRAGALCDALLATTPPLEVVDAHILPALDAVGRGFEAGTLYLPQLLMSAEAATAAFEKVQQALKAAGGLPKTAVFVIATVQGDIHDIGKNIVRTLLENYGFEVVDLGRDVPPQTVVDAVVRTHAPLCGLSALMTTTVAAMQATIELVHAQAPWCRVVVGGAVLNAEYARAIGADCYAKDAMETVRYARRQCGME